MEDAGRNSFDDLVAGISAEERKFLLAKLNQNRDKALPILQPLREDTDGVALELKLRTESFLYAFFLWLRSLFTKRDKLELYNEDLVASLARKLNKNHPGLINHQNSLLLSLFYEKLKELKTSADFFRPYIAIFNENPGKFYVFLSSFITPEIGAAINRDADPYSVPFTREGSAELRASLLKKMESILKDINSESRARLYESVKAVIWLKRFVELPHIHFIAQFTSIVSDQYTCPYTNAQVDFPSFISVLEDARSIPNEVLESLFLFPQRRGGAAVELDTETEKNMREYLTKAAASISMIQMFISTVPLSALGKVVFSDYDYQIEQSGGGEDWFQRFKEEWKVIFDQRWELWIRDRKKVQLADTLRDNFGVESFPELPFRPWAKLWGGLMFRCEMTGGFLYWFASVRYENVMSVLNVLILEGMFINNENRAELSEALNNFSMVNQRVLEFGDSLSSHGSFGSIFDKFILDHVRTVKAQSQAESMILNAESSVRNWEKLFCDACRSIDMVLHGILDDEKDNHYESISNFMTIKGRENHEYRHKLTDARKELRLCRHILSEIEPLDLPKKEKKN